MRTLTFSSRNIKEIMRDPISYIFSLGLPIILIAMYRIIDISVSRQTSDPTATSFFKPDNLVPGIAVFSLAFVMLNIAILVSKDKSTAFLSRLFTSPMTVKDYILGYLIPMIPFGIALCIICYITGICFGMTFNAANILMSLLFLIPSILFYVGLGILFGSLFNDKSAPPMSSFIVTFSTLIGGVWFDLRLMGDKFYNICHWLPFANMVDLAKSTLNGDFTGLLKPFLITAAYTIVIYILAVLIFKKQMRKS